MTSVIRRLLISRSGGVACVRCRVSAQKSAVRVRVLTSLALGAVAFLVLLDLEPAIAGSCGGKPPFTNLCKRCTTVQDRTTSRDTPCSRGVDKAGLIIVGSSIAKQPQHGRLQISGAAWTYTPAKGFVGSDVAIIERDFIAQDKSLFVTYSEIHMTVGP